jgi:putative phosphoribosyl transferase
MALIGEVVDWPYPAFEDRKDAGDRLAQFLVRHGAAVDLVVGVPSGGVAVAAPIVERLAVPLDIVLVRKLPLPMAPEAGFGAVTLDGQVVLNEALARHVDTDQRRQIVARVMVGLRERDRRLMQGRRHLDPAGKNVLLVDDGLASGFTAVAAVKSLRRQHPGTLSVAVPDAPLATVEELEPLVDEAYCLVAQTPGSFAVASFYRRWHDMADSEVIAILDQHRKEEGEAPDRRGGEPPSG